MYSCLNLLPNSFIFYTSRTLQLGKINDFWKDGKCIDFFVKFHTDTEKSLSAFWPRLLEQPIEFVLISVIFLEENMS